MTGICFVGYMDLNVRIGLVLIPVTAAFGIMAVFFWKGFYKLMNYLLNNSSLLDETGRKFVKAQAMRVLTFLTFLTITIVSLFGLEINQMQMRPEWQQSLRKSLV